MKKKLLILGANPETAGLVIKANEMGITTYVADNNPKAYAKQYADFPCNIDAMDIEKLEELIVSEKIDGVICGVAEALIQIYAQICMDMNLPCFGNKMLFNIFADKKKFKETCIQNSVPVIQEYSLSDISEDNILNVDFPIIVKPVDSSSSKGISVCKNKFELSSAIEKALSFSPTKRIIIEKYMDGEEVIEYYAFQNGIPSLVAMCDRYVNNEQSDVVQLPTAYIFPSKHLKNYLDNVDKKTKDMFKNVGVNNGFMFIQSFIDKDGNACFYEAGYRLNGAQEHYIVDAFTGIDAKECLINYALYGKEASYMFTDKADPFFGGNYACKLSVLVKLGKIKNIVGLEKIRKMSDVISINPSYNEGDEVIGYGTLKQIVCRFFVISDTIKKLKDNIDTIYSLFDVIGEDDNSMLLSQFDTSILENSYE